MHDKTPLELESESIREHRESSRPEPPLPPGLVQPSLFEEIKP